jgi:hypothetical protein
MQRLGVFDEMPPVNALLTSEHCLGLVRLEKKGSYWFVTYLLVCIDQMLFAQYHENLMLDKLLDKHQTGIIVGISY